MQPAERCGPGPALPGSPVRPAVPPASRARGARSGTRSGLLQRLGLVGRPAPWGSADEPLSVLRAPGPPRASPAAQPCEAGLPSRKSSSRGRSGCRALAAPADTIPLGLACWPARRLARHRPRGSGSRRMRPGRRHDGGSAAGGPLWLRRPGSSGRV